MSKDYDKELPDFLLDDSGFQKAVRNLRRKTIIKNVVTTSIVLILLYGLVFLGSHALLNRRIEALDIAESRWLYISEPNVQQNGVEYNYNLFTANGVNNYSKKFGDRVVPWLTRNSHFTLLDSKLAIDSFTKSYSEEEKQWLVFNNQNGQRELQFYHPSINYNQLPNAIKLLDQMDPNTYVEYALSFDRGYSFSEIQNLLDSKDTEWLWIDTQSETEITEKEEMERKGLLSSFQKGRVYGYRYNAVTNWPTPEFFVQELEHSEIQSSVYKTQAKRILQQLRKTNPELKAEKIRIIGAVVTGTPNELKKYQDKTFIRASSLGATTKKY